MKDRINRIKNLFPDEKYDNLDNKKLLEDINKIYDRSTEELNNFNNKIIRLLNENNKNFLNEEKEKQIFNDYNKNYQMSLQDETERLNTNKPFNYQASRNYEILKEREEDFKAIYEYNKKNFL